MTTSPDTYNDGSANAPAGMPELPNLLANYAVRPPWMVAGVDYSVGVPAGLALLDPATISMAGVIVDATRHIIEITGNGVTLSGYDFSLNGGWGITIDSDVTNTTIENSNFLVGSNELVPINAPGNADNLTILNNTFNGGGQTNGAAWAMVSYNGNGTVTAEYNMFENTPEDAIEFGQGNMTTIVQYNVFQNLGTEPGSHPDAVQYYGTNSTNSVISFNTITSGEEGIQIDAQGGDSTLLNTAVDNNVVVAQGPEFKISYLIAVLTQGPGTTVNGVQVENNYLDWSGAFGPFYGPNNSSNVVYRDNVDMVTGALTPSPSGTVSSDVSSVTASPANGISAAGSIITFTLNMDEAVFVTGMPSLNLNDAGIATYDGGSGTNALTFTYTVGPENTAVAALAITEVNLSGGAAIRDSQGNEANLAGALVSFGGLTISSAGVARTLAWTGSQDNNFGNAANWNNISGVQGPAVAAPGSADTAEFLTGGGAISGTGVAAALTFDSGGSWQLASGAILNVSGTVSVGVTTATNLLIEGSNLVEGDVATIAATGGAGGASVTVTGVGSSWQIGGALTVGGASLGSLSISQGATVSATSAIEGAASGGNGVITVVGTASALTLAGSLTVGSQAAGEISVLGGGTITALDVTIGNASAASSGNVDVEGAGSTLHILTGGALNIGAAAGGSGVLTIGANATLTFGGTIVEAGHASFNNNGGVVNPDAVQFISSNNAGIGLNQYNLYVENLGAVQIIGGTGIWDTPMVLTGTSVADAQNNINTNRDVGQWQLSQNGTLVINANTVDVGQAIVFEDATDTLWIGQMVNGGSLGVSGQTPAIGAENLLQAGGFHAAIWGYQAGDQILFNNLPVVSDQIVNGNTLELFGAGGTDLGSLTFMTQVGNEPLGVTAMAAAAQQMACFAAGTLIETVDGPRPVETLAVGDEVVTLLGGPGRIVWVGSRAVDCAHHPRPETVWPVRIAARALEENIPACDLFVSPDHAIYIDNVLIPAKHLLNGTTVRQVEWRRVTYHHIELAQHDVVLANGLPAETYLDTGDRAKFLGAKVTERHPDFSNRIWEAMGCATLIVCGQRLAAARQRLNAQAETKRRYGTITPGSHSANEYRLTGDDSERRC